MLTTVQEPRVLIEDNFWLERGSPEDLESPPSGKLLKVIYSNGDALSIEFVELESEAAVRRRYADTNPENWGISFPITVVELYEKIGGTEFEFGPVATTLPGHNVIRDCFFMNNSVGLAIG